MRSNCIVLLKIQGLEEHKTIQCDSSMNAGGEFLPEHYNWEAYPNGITQTVKVISLVVALKALAPAHLVNQKLIINVDKSDGQQVQYSCTGRDPVLTACAREAWLNAEIDGCEIKTLYNPGKSRVMANALSKQTYIRHSNCHQNP